MVRFCGSTRREDVTPPAAPPRSDGAIVPVDGGNAADPEDDTAPPQNDELDPAVDAEVPDRHMPAQIRFAVVGSDVNFKIGIVELSEVTYEELKSRIAMANKIKKFDMYLAKEWGQEAADIPWLQTNGAVVELQRLQIREEVKAKFLAPSKRIDAKTFKAAAFTDLGEVETAIHVLVAIDEPTGCCPCAPEWCRVFLSLLVLSFLAMAIVGYIYFSSKNEKGRPDYLWSEPLAQIGVVCIGTLGFLVTVCYCVNFRA